MTHPTPKPSVNEIATLTGEIGSLLAGKLKDFVEMEKFKGRSIDIFMSKGWISKRFCIRGNEDDVRYIQRAMDHWNEQLENSK